MTARAAAEILRAHDRDGTRLDAFPADLAPHDLAGGYAIQDAFADQRGVPARGWKIAATSAGGRATLGVDGPLAGRLFADALWQDTGTIPLPATAMGIIEVEVAFIIGRDIAPGEGPRGRSALLEALSSVHVAIEVPQTRWRDVAAVGMPSVAADNACGGGVLLGPPVAPALWQARDLAAIGASIGPVDGPRATGSGANVMGDPLAALEWLIGALSGRGIGLAAGEIISSGSLTPPPRIARGAEILAQADGLGHLRVLLD